MKHCAAGTVAVIGDSRPEYFIAMFCEPQTGMDPASFLHGLAATLPAGRDADAVVHLASAPWKRFRRKRGAPSQLCLWWTAFHPQHVCLLPDDLQAPVGWLWAKSGPRGWRIPRDRSRLWLSTRQAQEGAARCRIRAGVVRCLALGDPDRAVHEHGVHIRGAWIDDGLDFSGSDVSRRLVLDQCHVAGPVNVGGAQIPSVHLGGSRVSGFVADGLRTRGAVTLNGGFYSYSVVRMLGARIGTDVNCRGGSFNCNETVERGVRTVALVLDGAEVSGYVYLNAGFRANGTVRLIGTRVRGDVVCNGGRYGCSEIDSGGDALILSRASIDGSLYLSRPSRRRTRGRSRRSVASAWSASRSIVISSVEAGAFAPTHRPARTAAGARRSRSGPSRPMSADRLISMTASGQTVRSSSRAPRSALTSPAPMGRSVARTGSRSCSTGSTSRAACC